MAAFQQHDKRKNAWFAFFGGLVFIGLAVDTEFTNFALPAGLREEGPWMFWALVILGSVAAVGAAWQLVAPPRLNASLEINLSPSDFGLKRRNAGSQFVPWDQVKAIGVGEVGYTRNGYHQSEPALRIEFRDSVHVAGADDMHAIQTGTPAKFAAAAQQKGKRAVTWQESHGLRANQNVVLIGEQHFEQNVHQVCDRLQKLAARHSPS
jgi:hypothetical protein